jgi:hypothetical protein
MKRTNLLILLSILSITALLSTSCRNLVGTTVTSSVTPGFNIKNYSRFLIKSDKQQLTYEVAKQAMLEQGFIPFNGPDKTGQLFIYSNEDYGLCFPCFNLKSLLWIQFTFPTNANITLKDAKTLENVVEVDYKRGYFSIGPGEERCKEELRNKLYKTLKDLKLNSLPKPIDMNNDSL